MQAGDWKEMFKAACEGDLALLSYHLQAGVDANYAHPEFLSTPLVAAILAGQEEAALLLLEQGADPRRYSEFDAMRPMQAAEKMAMTVVVGRLQQAGVATQALPSRPWWKQLLGRA